MANKYSISLVIKTYWLVVLCHPCKSKVKTLLHVGFYTCITILLWAICLQIDSCIIKIENTVFIIVSSEAKTHYVMSTYRICCTVDVFFGCLSCSIWMLLTQNCRIKTSDRIVTMTFLSKQGIFFWTLQWRILPANDNVWICLFIDSHISLKPNSDRWWLQDELLCNIVCGY